MAAIRVEQAGPAPTDLPAVSIITLNWNGRRHLGPLLSSLANLDYPTSRMEVIVADNASSDDSIEFVRAEFPAVRIVALSENHGFAEGNNRAAREASNDWIAFINNDMRVDPGWLRNLVAPVATNPALVAVSAKILNWDGSAIDYIGAGINFQGFGFQVDTGLAESPADVPGRILCPCGGAMLVGREVFLEVGGFDGDFFGFYEDTDLGWRLNLLGHDVWYEPAAVCYHRGHGTFDSVRAERTRLLYERNSLFSMYKNLDDSNLAAALPASMLLLNEKALRMADVDRRPFRLGGQPEEAASGVAPSGAADSPYAFDPGIGSTEGLVARARTVLRLQGPGTVVRKARRYVASRASARAARLVRRALLPGANLPGVSIAHYLALSDFAHQLPELKKKRDWIQARRVRSDSELLPLFLFALEPSYHDPEYMRIHQRLVRVLGLDHRFAAGQRRPAV